MPKFLKTKGVSSCIENIIDDSSERIVLVTPYVFISPSLTNRLLYASKRGVNITMIISSKFGELKEAELLKWEKIGMNVYTNPHLHAKAYYNESDALVTSLNLIDTSEKNNFEMGISTNVSEHRDLYTQIVKECDYILAQSARLEFTSGKIINNSDANDKEELNEVRGFCIRCKTHLDYNLNKPYCPNCYWEWDKNSFSKEKYCHSCGVQNDEITFKRSICLQCSS